MPMNLLVIGSNCFSALHFIDLAINNGANVLGVGRSKIPKPYALPKEWGNELPFEFEQLDINKDLAKFKQRISTFKPNLVANFAAQGMVAQSWLSPQDWYRTNILSSVEIIEWLKTRDFLDRFLQISTPEVYGSQSHPVPPQQVFSPSTPYAISKATLDQHIMVSCEHQDFPATFVRSANFYGPGQALYRVIPKAFLTFLTGNQFYLQGAGQSLRSFVHIEDVAKGYWKAMNKGDLGGVYHFSSPELMSIESLVTRIANICQVDIEAHITHTQDRMGKDKAYALCTKDTEKKLNWSPNISLSDGLIYVHQWVTEHLGSLKNLSWEYQHQP